jgi:uncharacterized protein (TIGR03067 family)
MIAIRTSFTWPAVVLFVCVASVAVQAQTETGLSRVHFVYHNHRLDKEGYFKLTESNTWVEACPGVGFTCTFKEVARNDDFVELYDESRRFGIRIYDRECVEHYSGLPDGEWRSLYRGAWRQPTGATRRDQPLDQPSDQRLLQGTWICVATFKDGQPVQTFVGVKAIIRDDRMTWIFPQGDGGEAAEEAAVTIDANQRHFDWYYLTSGPSKMHRRLYSLEGDTLRWADSTLSKK